MKESLLEFPENNNEWEDDVFEAVDEALKQVGAKEDDELSPELENLYFLAPALAAQRRKVKDQELKKEMEQHAIDGVKQDISLAPESRRFWLFHFVLAYVHSHVPIEIVDELAMDRVMDYINDRNDLFHT